MNVTEKLGFDAQKVLQYIHQKEKVTISELEQKFPDNRMLIASLTILQENRFIYRNYKGSSDDDSYDYCIQSFGENYIQCIITENMENDKLTEHFNNVKRIDSNVSDINMEIANLTKQVEELKADLDSERIRAKQAEKKTKTSSQWFTLGMACLSVILSNALPRFINWIINMFS
jgi:hypothetical protein